MRVWGYLKRFWKIIFLGYCNILMGMVLYSCSKGQGTKTKVQFSIQKNCYNSSNKKGSFWTKQNKIKIFPKAGNLLPIRKSQWYNDLNQYPHLEKWTSPFSSLMVSPSFMRLAVSQSWKRSQARDEWSVIPVWFWKFHTVRNVNRCHLWLAI